MLHLLGQSFCDPILMAVASMENLVTKVQSSTAETQRTRSQRRAIETVVGCVLSPREFLLDDGSRRSSFSKLRVLEKPQASLRKCFQYEVQLDSATSEEDSAHCGWLGHTPCSCRCQQVKPLAKLKRQARASPANSDRLQTSVLLRLNFSANAHSLSNNDGARPTVNE